MGNKLVCEPDWHDQDIDTELMKGLVIGFHKLAVHTNNISYRVQAD